MIVPMARIRVLGPSSRLSAVIALFQEIGAIHIESAPPEIRRLQSDIPVIKRHVLDPAAQQTRLTLETAIEKVRQLLLVLPPLPEERDVGEIGDLVPDASGADPLKAVNVRLDTLSVRAASLAAEMKRHQDEQSLFARYDKVLKVLAPLIGMVRESRELECTGLILSAKEAAVATLLEDALSLLTDGRFEILYREVDKETLAALLIFPVEKAAEARSLLWEKNIGELRLPASVAEKPLPEALEIIARRQAELPAAIREIETKLAGMSLEWRGPLLGLRRWLGNRIERIRASASFYETRATFLFHGWVPESELPRVRKAIAEAFGDLVIVERLPIARSEKEGVPVVLRNHAVVRPFEIFTRVLPLPRYGTIDPTPLVAVFFPLFYGIIIGDIGYGLLLLAIARIVRWRYGRNPLVADATAVFSWAALSAVAWGFAYGELFGDLGERLGLRPLLFGRMGDFRKILLFAVGIGVVHVCLGIGLGIYTAIRRGKGSEAVSKAAGLALLAAVGAAIAGGAGWVPRAVFHIGLTGIPVSLLVMILSGGIGAAMEVHNLVNIFSYLRITGIGVASVSLAYTANRLVPLVGIPVLGILAGLTLHAINLAFCVLSPTIQAIRLHYVEFFENFFIGGGRAYHPFRTIS
ncbi:MAG: V-type ATPase 116kDa subunit family protein [bacterium]|jgi:V/A-type H+-transporting ATPase subunit I